MTPKAPEKDPRLQAMRLRFVTEEEQQKLVASWPAVERRDSSTAMYREWFAAAGIVDSFRATVWARSLQKLGICLEDGTVDPDVARVIAAGMIARLAGGQRRKR